MGGQTVRSISRAMAQENSLSSIGRTTLARLGLLRSQSLASMNAQWPSWRTPVSQSWDGGATWSAEGLLVDSGPTGYSQLVIMGGDTVGVLYETVTTAHWNGELYFSSFPLSDLPSASQKSDGEDHIYI